MELLIIRRTKTLKNKDEGKFKRSYFAQDKEVFSEILDENLDIISSKGDLPDGIVKEFYESGLVYFECPFKNGKRSGVSRTFYESGKINVEKRYRGGLLNGSAFVYYPSGRLKEAYSYVDDIENGARLKYYPNGRALETSQYKDGFLEGLSKTYYDEGNTESESRYEKDKIVGDKITYHRNGVISMICPHINGEPDGVAKRFSENGRLIEEWIFGNGGFKYKNRFA
jgi:antitoxin component YwqK of YwqJK toxin-antitoxin module